LACAVCDIRVGFNTVVTKMFYKRDIVGEIPGIECEHIDIQ